MELNFQKQRINVIDLSTLKRTFKENDVMGNPLRGMYHYDLIEKVGDILLNKGLSMQIEEIFAAQSGDKNTPSVTVSPVLAQQYGETAPEAHLLRRVYANINVADFDNDEFTTHVAVAWHQKGIQVAFGPTVKICHNLCIMGRGQVLTTGKDMTIERLLEKFSDLMFQLPDTVSLNRGIIERMKGRVMSPQEILCSIGSLTAMRVAHDTLKPEIRRQDMYPLNQAQISKFTESLLVKQKAYSQVTAWDLYNAGTELLKPNSSDIPSLFDQHVALSEYVITNLL